MPAIDPDLYDAVVIGGAIAGAGTAITLLKKRPGARVLIVEQAERFERKVGEATVECSALWLTAALGLGRTLAEHHLPKFGLRFFFDNGLGDGLADLDELGPKRQAAMASFHLDRPRLDEQALAAAADRGAEVLRPAAVRGIELGENGRSSTLTLHAEDAEPRTVRARWVIDASGRRGVLARKLGLQEKLPDHPVSSSWARWDGVADADGPAIQGPDPARPRMPRIAPPRALSTNHFCGHGWWSWVIPLKGGRTSVGLTFDRRLFEPPAGVRLAGREPEAAVRGVRAVGAGALATARGRDHGRFGLRELPRLRFPHDEVRRRRLGARGRRGELPGTRSTRRASTTWPSAATRGRRWWPAARVGRRGAGLGARRRAAGRRSREDGARTARGCSGCSATSSGARSSAPAAARPTRCWPSGSATRTVGGG